MDEISSFVEKIRPVFIVKKKKDFDLSKYQICFMGCKKKSFVMTKIQICFVI